MGLQVLILQKRPGALKYDYPNRQPENIAESDARSQEAVKKVFSDQQIRARA